MVEKKTPTAVDDQYGADQIRRLKGLEAVRLRPGMYVGGTDQRALHHLIWEIVDNAIDEALAGHCSEIWVRLDEEKVVTVSDNGRGVPVGINKEEGRSALDLVFTELHAGGKFEEGGYKVSGGLHGVGASVTNALSDWLEVTVSRDGHEWTARYQRGIADNPKDPVQKGRALKKGEATGTTVRWRYDETIFDPEVHYSRTLIEQRLREKSYLVRGLKIHLELPGREAQTFYSEQGIADLVAYMNDEQELIHRQILRFSSVEHPEWATEEQQVQVELALQWTRADDERIYSFANIIPTVDGGAHVTGMRTAITRALNQFAYEKGKLKRDKKESLDGRDVFSGLTAAVLVLLPDPQFEGQTKGKLNNAEAQRATQVFTYAAMSDWLGEKRNQTAANAILELCLKARELRMKIGQVTKKHQQATSIFADTPLPGKLSDCTDQRNPWERELFIVEGDSACGTGKSARDATFQALLPIRGKILNVFGQKEGRAFANAEVESILLALGGRKDVIGRRLVATLRAGDMRYGSVVLLSDADQDGAHIQMLLLGLFHELFPQMIRDGRLFMALPPLFRINLDARGEKFIYAFTDRERDELLQKHRRSGEDVSRFKGLGEMNPDDLRRTCFDPETRSLVRVTIEDAAHAAGTLGVMLGNRAEARRNWLEDVGIIEDAV